MPLRESRLNVLVTRSAVAVFGKTSDRANQFRLSSRMKAAELHKVVKGMIVKGMIRAEAANIHLSVRKREPQFVRLNAESKRHFSLT